jgi:hypothetical protein
LNTIGFEAAYSCCNQNIILLIGSIVICTITSTINNNCLNQNLMTKGNAENASCPGVVANHKVHRPISLSVESQQSTILETQATTFTALTDDSKDGVRQSSMRESNVKSHRD